MNEEKKLHKLIQSRGAENSEKILDEIKAACPQYFDEPKIESKKSAKKKTLAVCFSVGAVAVSLAIILPIALHKEESPADNPNRYATAEDYNVVEYEQTIKQYAQANNLNVLYFDWYDNADLCQTWSYLENNTQEVLGLKENIVDGESGESVVLQFTDSNTYIDILEEWNGRCVNEYTINTILLKWALNDMNLNGIFEYDGYRYYVTLEMNTDENRLFELVGSLIENKE